MKAKLRGTTGAYFDVTEVNACLVKDSIPFVRYFADDEGTIYDEQQLEFEPELLPDASEKVIEGWVAVDEFDFGDAFIHTEKPSLKSNAIADAGDYYGSWESCGKSYSIDHSLFPDLTYENSPKKYRITITPIEE